MSFIKNEIRKIVIFQQCVFYTRLNKFLYLDAFFIFQGRGFIKEVSFSHDGLVLASPYDSGVRLLSFNPEMEDLSYRHPNSLDEKAQELNVVGHIEHCHDEVVLSTSFSPHHFLLVTGCRGGTVQWHHPML